MKRLLVFLFALSLTGTLFAAPDPQCFTASRDARSTLARELLRDNPADEIIFTEDFENGAEGWTTTDYSGHDTIWHKSNFQGAEDNLVWWCGDTLTAYDDDPIGYDNNWLQFLDTPALDLSEAGENLMLTFDAWWLLEDPRIVPRFLAGCQGYDGWLVYISDDGGENFSPLQPVSPAYHGARLKAAEVRWELGETPGWFFISAEADDFPDTTRARRPEVNWIACSFDLSAHRAADIVIRFALISDGSVAAPFANVYLQESGVCIDNLLISDGETDYLVNNADADPVPSELVASHGEGMPSGDHWELTQADRHRGQFSMWNTAADNRNMLNALDSPPFAVLEDINTLFQFWVHCDLPDWDSDGNGTLEDFYQVFVSNDGGETWAFQFVDYARDVSGGSGWAHYVPGTPYPIQGVDVNIDMTLDAYAGEEIQLRWLFRTDNDEGGGVGSGLFLDDLEVLGVDRQPLDAGMRNLNLPYPVTVGYRSTGFTVEMHNFGTRDLASIPAFWGWESPAYSGEYPIAPYRTVDAGEMLLINLTDPVNPRLPGWTPDQPGVFDVWAKTTLGSVTPANPNDDDQVPANDSVGVSDVVIWPANIFEMGYDARTPQFFYNFAPNTGAAVRFRGPDAGLQTFSIALIRLLFNHVDEAVNFRLHIYGENNAQPGNQLLNREVQVTPESSFPHWLTVPVYDVQGLQNRQDRFWVWAEMLRDDNLPQIVGHDQLVGQGRCYSYDGNQATGYNADLMIHAVMVPHPVIQPTIAASTRDIAFGLVYIDQVAVRPITLYSTAYAPLTITEVSVEGDIFSVDWLGETVLNFGESITFEVLYEPPAVGFHQANLNITCNAAESPFIIVAGSGIMSVPDDPVTPRRFALENPYPNPFNNSTLISFSLERAGVASVKLFDLNGREVMTVAAGRFNEGENQIALKGDDLAAGVYLLSLSVDSRTAIRKLVLVK